MSYSCVLISYDKKNFSKASHNGFDGNESVLKVLNGALEDCHYFVFSKSGEEWKMIFNLDDDLVKEFHDLEDFLSSEYPEVDFMIVKEIDQGFYYNEDNAYIEKSFIQDKYDLKLEYTKMDDDRSKYSSYYNQVPIENEAPLKEFPIELRRKLGEL